MSPQQRAAEVEKAFAAQTVGFTTALTKAMATPPSVPEVATTSCTSSTCRTCTSCKKGGKR
ncbi:hypothetical protein [Streptosporangium saharense]|uniref:hypothetical protein n=1 Tax=Streptosporangium saharense TaxID=1706840 RepID=UPI00341A8731